MDYVSRYYESSSVIYYSSKDLTTGQWRIVIVGGLGRPLIFRGPYTHIIIRCIIRLMRVACMHICIKGVLVLKT